VTIGLRGRPVIKGVETELATRYVYIALAQSKKSDTGELDSETTDSEGVNNEWY